MTDKPQRKAKTPRATLETQKHATGSTPGLLVEGDAPSKGSKFTAILPNGVTYSGIVADVLDRDGVNLVTFRDGITPVK